MKATISLVAGGFAAAILMLTPQATFAQTVCSCGCGKMLAACHCQNSEKMRAAADPNVIVPRGQVTFDAEGFKPDPSVPSDSSGVTIGRGYDLKERSAKQVEKDLIAIGLDPSDAKLYADGVGLKGEKAREWAANAPVPQLTNEQAKKLFQLEYTRMEDDVKRISNKPDAVKAYGRVDFSKVDPALMELVVDLRFRGDYTPETRAILQKHLVNNDLPGMLKALSDPTLWYKTKVPNDRVNRRLRFLEDTLKPE